MTIDEAIQHAIEVAKSNTCPECAEQHKQLARWLIKLKIYELKEEHKSYPIYPINELGKHSYM
jgi:hypothetical protein